MEKEKDPRGGKREGAGRPATNRHIAVSVRISPEAYEILETIPNKSEYLDRLIRENNNK